MKIEDLKTLKKGTLIVSSTSKTWIEGTYEGLTVVTRFGRFTNIKDACDAIKSGKGRKHTMVIIKDEYGNYEYVSPRSVHIVPNKKG